MQAECGHLVLIETASNQNYIFGSNRLREQIGASELVSRAARWMFDAVLGAVDLGSDLRALLEKRDPLERIGAVAELGKKRLVGPGVVEILAAASGKAVLLVESEAVGRDIIAKVTARALEEAPGLVVRGFVGEKVRLDAPHDDAEGPSAGDRAMERVHHGIEQLRFELPPPEGRFLRLPFVRPCASTGAPANAFVAAPGGGERQAASLATIEKLKCFKDGLARISAAADPNGERQFARRIDQLDPEGEPPEWLGVIHADGNGFGQIFLEFDQRLKSAEALSYDRTPRQYFDYYRDFSLALDRCSIVAFRRALEEASDTLWSDHRGRRFPVLPVVLGGDDLSVVCDGADAIDFAISYLEKFEETTQSDPLIGALSGGHGLGAAAGVAIVKPHHPFYRAHEMADALAKSAKSTKKRLGTAAISAIDYQILLDGAPASLEDMRANWRVGPEAVASARPYVTSSEARIEAVLKGMHRPGEASGEEASGEEASGEEASGEEASGKFVEEAKAWLRNRRSADLRAAATALSERAERKPGKAVRHLPRSQQHALRDALFLGADIADARLNAIRPRYEISWEAIAPSGSLYFEHRDAKGNRVLAARLLDALELADLRSPLDVKPSEAATAVQDAQPAASTS